MILDHEPVSIESFKGLFGRGEFGDTVPTDHFVDSLNSISIGQEVKTRDGFLIGISTPGLDIRRIWEYKRQGEASRLIILNSVGQFFDSALSLTVPILTVAGATDFAAISQYNRAYISPHNGTTGIAGEFVYVYTGAGVARKVSGVAPASGFIAANSINTGIVESGTHIIGVAFETESGFITAPGQLTTVVADGTKKIDLSAIPTGPIGTVARRIVASRAIQSYNGDLEGYEMFFVPDGRIADNVSTTLTIDFYDADLQQTVDYAFDQLAEIPSVVNIISYGTRLVYIGSQLNPSIAYISKPGEPESINELSGFLICGPTEAEGLRNGCEFRDSLYLTKADKLYATRDNGYDPSTWSVMDIDKGIGADSFSLSVIQDNRGANLDFFLLGARSGLYIFNGTMVKPELSYKILNWWSRINKAVFNKVQVIIDTDNFRVYILVPLDAATSCSHIIVGDFTEGITHSAIKWHIWTSAAFQTEAISVSISNTTKKTYLRVAGRAGNVFNQTVGELNDTNIAIDSYFWTSYEFLESGWVHHCAGIGLRVMGSGNLQISLRGEDNTLITNYNSLPITMSPGREYFRHANLNNEKIGLKVRTSFASEYWKIKKAILYIKPVWATRPG